MQEKSSSSEAGSERLVVGVDVGGTKIAAGVISTNGQVYSRVQRPTDIGGPERTLQSIAAGISEAILAAGVRKEQIHGVGLGIPGEVDPEQGIGLFSANLGWRTNVVVTGWLEDALGLPCAIENDVSVAALGEHLYGAGQGVHTMLYVSLGTGIAARAVIDGKLHRGSHGLAGEIGHTVFVPDGPLCLCGARGCLEALASGPALARLAQEKMQAGCTTLLSNPDILKRGEKLTAEHLFAAIAQDDSLSRQIVAEAGAHLAYAVYLLAMSFDPQIIVLGGGLAHEENPLIETIHNEVARWAARSPVFQEIWTSGMLRLTALKRDVGILGAAALINR